MKKYRLLIGGICMVWSSLVWGGTYIKNGSFETGIESWASKIEGKTVSSPGFVTHVADDGAENTRGCLKAVINIPDDASWYSHSSGVVCSMSSIPADTTVRIHFYAKRKPGSSPILSIARTFGGAFETVELSKRWKKYSVDMTVPVETGSLIFSLVEDQNRKKSQKLVEGEFFLDELRLEVLEK
jgi:hypothetical protein